MKKLSIILLALITVASVSAQTKSMGNSKVNNDFTKYKSFTWVHSLEHPVLNEQTIDSESNAVIQNAIYSELEGRGYRENPDHGDLIVVYRVLDKKGKIHGYKDDYPVETYTGKQIRQPADTVTFAVAPGTVMVNFIDAKTDETVWTGFSSGVVHNLPESAAISNDELELREAVHLIFESFKYEVAPN
jgi:hypothetical protein